MRERISYTVAPIDGELARQLWAQMNRSLNGDGSCSLENQRRSCFANEYCATGASPASSVAGLVAAPHCFVAVAHDEELSLPTIGARVIVADHIKGVPILRCWACGDCNSRLTHYFDTPSNPEAVLCRCAEASHMRADRVGTTPG